MKRNAFSFVEIIVASFIFLLVFIPALKINSQQVQLIKKIEISDLDISFFHSITSYLKAKDCFVLDDVSFNFQNYEALKNNSIFADFDLSYSSKDTFILNIDFKYENIDFYNYRKDCNIINIKFSKFNKIYNCQIIKFKD